MSNEEELFEAQFSRNLLTLGWIHTHPTQGLFLSAVDSHTHHAYQVGFPEAIAVVVAPTTPAPHFSVFNLTAAGISDVGGCQQRGFHPHEPQPFAVAPHVDLVEGGVEVIDIRHDKGVGGGGGGGGGEVLGKKEAKSAAKAVKKQAKADVKAAKKAEKQAPLARGSTVASMSSNPYDDLPGVPELKRQPTYGW